MKAKKRSHRYDINRPRSIHGHKYSKRKKCQYGNAYIATPKQHLKLNSWKGKQHWGWVKKTQLFSVILKKSNNQALNC